MKNGYASRIENPAFSISTIRRSNFNLLRVEEELSAVHLRLARVYIENMSYEHLIPRFDKPDTFFYLDPPYYGCENYYGPEVFCRDDFKKLRDLLEGIKGKFIMSINDTSQIRVLFKGFYVERVKTIYSSPKDIKKRVTELLIMNFKPRH
jgi:DNA adenine methylase